MGNGPNHYHGHAASSFIHDQLALPPTNQRAYRVALHPAVAYKASTSLLLSESGDGSVAAVRASAAAFVLGIGIRTPPCGHSATAIVESTMDSLSNEPQDLADWLNNPLSHVQRREDEDGKLP